MKRELVIVMHNIRSIHNVGSIFRTSEGLGVQKIIISGYTPYPDMGKKDNRLPHLSKKINSQISKTALGAENNIEWNYTDKDILEIIKDLKKEGFIVASLEQNNKSQDIKNFKPPKKIALILGNEIDGVEHSVLANSDCILEIEMPGKKESLNVSNAAAIAIYRLLFLP